MRPVVPIAGVMLAALVRAAGAADDVQPETILIVAERDARTSKGATGLDLSVADTPQSVTIIDRDTMDRFALDDANDVLRMTTGVNVDSVETDRTYYNSRGFDIKSMQVDGIGLPFNWNVVGALDTAVYDKVEVVRGANGLLTGTGNPSGTINYVRKRPMNTLMAQGEVTLGSWNRRRIEADVSTPFNASGSWAGRLVVAAQDGDSWLNLYNNRRSIFQGIVDGELGSRVTLTLGYTQQDNKSRGVLWGALPLQFTDGTQTDYDVSTTTSMNWTYWNTYSKTAFAELGFKLSANWQSKIVVTYNDYHEPSELFYTYGLPDRASGLGLLGYPGKYEQNSHGTIVDATLSGTFALGGHSHELLLGVSDSKQHNTYLAADAPADDPAWGALPAFPGWNGAEIGRPAFSAPYLAGEWDTKLRRLYGATRFSVSDGLKLIIGVNALDAKTSGDSFGASMNAKDNALSPYVGLTWRIVPQLNAYASYSDIYEPQPDWDVNHVLLGPAKGRSYEAGLKGEWFGRRLLTTAAVFEARQGNYAQPAGYDSNGIAYAEGIDVRSRGYELEIAGRPLEFLTVQAGYTQLRLRDPSGADTRSFVPRQTFKLLGTLRVPGVTGLELGTSLRWQSTIHTGAIVQRRYALLGVQGSYRISPKLELGVNIDNVTDRKYLESLYWDQAYYGPPRNVQARVTLRY